MAAEQACGCAGDTLPLRRAQPRAAGVLVKGMLRGGGRTRLAKVDGSTPDSALLFRERLVREARLPKSAGIVPVCEAPGGG